MNRNDQDTGQFDLDEIRQHLLATRAFASGPSPVRVDIAVGARTHQGLVRTNNEDHFLAGRLGRVAEVLATNLPDGSITRHFEQEAYALAVADGMGGAAAGEVASSLALSLGTNLTLDAAGWPLELSPVALQRLTERVSAFFNVIDRTLADRARQDPGLEGMGTTLTVAYLVGYDAVIFHIGDSRAYLWRDGALTQLTRDETVAQAMVDSGDLTPDAAASHPMRHVLTRAMGAGNGQADAKAWPVRFAPGDRLLLCSDGLSDVVTDAAMAILLAADRPPQETADRLIEAALQGGGPDNVTAVVARFG
ncbi:MAG: PP2C family serine/threonine-protein phosphatase [Vicinamibacterales bacterium]